MGKTYCKWTIFEMYCMLTFGKLDPERNASWLLEVPSHPENINFIQQLTKENLHVRLIWSSVLWQGSSLNFWLLLRWITVGRDYSLPTQSGLRSPDALIQTYFRPAPGSNSQPSPILWRILLCPFSMYPNVSVLEMTLLSWFPFIFWKKHTHTLL